jgi:hypothetical protein
LEKVEKRKIQIRIEKNIFKMGKRKIVFYSDFRILN